MLKLNSLLYGQEHASGESIKTVSRFNHQLLAVMLRKYPNGQLPVAINNSQLRTRASETVDPNEWQPPRPSTAPGLGVDQVESD